MQQPDIKILCIDDDPAILDLYSYSVKAAGFTPILCLNPEDAIRTFKAEMQCIALVVCDLQMPIMNGVDVRKSLLPEGFSVPFIVVSGYLTKENPLQYLELKISGYFDKLAIMETMSEIIAKESKERIQMIRESQALESIFFDEATSILDDLEPLLVSLDLNRANPESINAIFRGVHTLKGSSGCLESEIITKYVHKYEDIISGLKEGRISLNPEIYEVLLKGLDRIKLLVAAIETKKLKSFRLEDIVPELSIHGKTAVASADKTDSHGADPAAAADPAKADIHKAKVKDSISVPITMLDELSSFSGEITVIRNMVNKIVRTLEVRFVGNKEIQSLGELLEEMHKVNSTIQSRITDLRKVPLSNVLKPLPRIIRDLGRDLGKNIKLHIEGDGLRVDNALAAVCSNSLVHLVRNSADHGIENPDDRKSVGKPEHGTVHINCTEGHEEVRISIRDDGRGIDHKKIRARALEKGLYTESELARMSEQEALGIIFDAGFSTAAVVTNVSGRGVGMDMVKSSVEAVGGRIDIDSRIGKGSTFTLRLPIPKSVMIINSLLVEAGRVCFAIPQDSILRILRIDTERLGTVIQATASGSVLRCDQKIYPLLDLASLLQLPKEAGRAAEVVEILLIQSEQLLFALQVDSVLDSEEIVVKRLQSCFNPSGVFAGSTFMGDGSIGLILDMAGLAELAGVDSAPTISSQDIKESTVSQLLAEQANPAQCNYLLFKIGSKGIYGAPLDQVFRLEEIEGERVQRSGAQRVVIYRDRLMPIHSVQRLLKLSEKDQPAVAKSNERLSIIVTQGKEGFVGFEVLDLVDIVSTDQSVSTEIRDRVGVTGNTTVRDHSVTIVNLHEILQLITPKAA